MLFFGHINVFSPNCQVLHGGSIIRERPYARLYRALLEDQKEFVAHPYCQVIIKQLWVF